MRQFVDQKQVRTKGQGRINVKLAQALAAIFRELGRKKMQTFDLRSSLAAPVCFDHTHQDIASFRLQLAGGREHGVGFPDPGGGAEVNAQLAARGIFFLRLNLGQQGVWVGALVSHVGNKCFQYREFDIYPAT